MTTNDYTLLYVEDDTDFAELNIGWFTGQGYRVIHAANGADAVRKAHEAAPDIVLLDIVLPDTTGFEVMKQIQTLETPPPVIFLTSLADPHSAITGLESGACDYIRKDTDIREIDARIRATLTRSGPHNDIIRLTENSHIDNRRLEIVVQGEAHKARHKVIKLLRTLLQYKGQRCQRDFLIDRVWGEKCINGDLYLNQSVGILRRMLAADKRLKLITYRNAGVVLEIASDKAENS